jgi:2-polyprenyl-3-methyl-5-hydroxy-6-metoxy-1,4-benzoquinol methylase
MLRPEDRWNHNIHYHRVILDAIPSSCQRALDIGCGDGDLTRQLRALIPDVIGIDHDQASIAAARRYNGRPPPRLCQVVPPMPPLRCATTTS